MRFTFTFYIGRKTFTYRSQDLYFELSCKKQ